MTQGLAGLGQGLKAKSNIIKFIPMLLKDTQLRAFWTRLISKLIYRRKGNHTFELGIASNHDFNLNPCQPPQIAGLNPVEIKALWS